MKIALIYFGRRGGGPVYSLEVAKEISKKAEIAAFISQGTENLEFWQESGIPLKIFSTYASPLGFLFSFFNIFKFWKIRREIKKFQPDVLYYPFFHPWQPVINVLFPKIPKVFTTHDPTFHKGERNFLLQCLQDLAIKQSERVIVLSGVFKEKIAEKGIARDKIDYAPHGIFDYYQKFRDSYIACPSTDMRHPTMLFFGRIIKYKGLDVLLEAFPLIKKQIPEVRLLIAGDGDIKPYEKTIEKLQKNGGEIEIVNRWIKDEEIGDYFSRVQLVVCPYIEASQSGVIPIAYMFKLPVVASRVGGLEEQVSHGITGFLVASGEREELADACVEILKDENKRKKMGQAGYEFAKSEWNWQRVAEKILESLRKAINKNF